MTAVLSVVKRASALSQEAALMMLPHGLQAQARRNARQAVIEDGVRRAARHDADAAISAQKSKTSRGRHYAAASG